MSWAALRVRFWVAGWGSVGCAVACRAVLRVTMLCCAVLCRRAVLNGKKKVFRYQFFQKSPRELHVLNHGWWRLAVGGGWWWAVGNWRLVAVRSWGFA